MARQSKVVRSILLAVALAGATGGVAVAAGPLKLVSASFMEIDAQLKSAKGHPNEELRLNGLKAYQSGHYTEAIDRFERAASYADKHSQHYLSLIYWHGQGVAPDPVRAYIWSDLAAERGSRNLLAIREKIWAELTPPQQQQVTAQGADFYARYGDEVTKPRAETEIRRFARGMTGSRVGFSNQRVDIAQGGPIHGSFGNATVGMLAASEVVVGTTTGDRFYADERVSMSQYWQRQDAELDSGRVDVGPVTPARGAD